MGGVDTGEAQQSRETPVETDRAQAHPGGNWRNLSHSRSESHHAVGSMEA